MSLGLVQYEKGDDDKLILKRADAVLYKAKESGRNKVVLG
jgi:PleD family two-component response regulator